ncbi:MAG: HU family DNA-binding protein [Bacteroidales bacterium]
MDIKNYIKQLLIDNQGVVIPGLGGFVADYEPAAFDVTENKFLPPTKKIIFNTEYSFKDQKLINFIAKKEKTDSEKAQSLLDDFVKSVKSKLNAGEKVDFPGIGVLSQTKKGEIIFTQDKNSNLLAEALGLKDLKTSPIETQARPSAIVPKKSKSNKKLFIYISSAALVLLLIALSWYFTEGYSNFNFISSSKTSPKEGIPVKKPKTKNYLDSIAKADSLKALINQSIDVTTDKKEALFYKEPETKPEEKQQYTQFHIIAGSFKKAENAEKFCRDLNQLGYEPEIIKSGENLFRISIYSYTDETSALKKLYKLRETSELNSVWILKSI